MNSFKIGEKTIGEKSPCFIIAEAGANFRISEKPEENFKQAEKLIEIAAKAGADAVKFQLYRAKTIYVKGAGQADYIGKKKNINQIIKEMELPLEWIPKLKKLSEEKGLVFLCSPFDEALADELEKTGIEAYKIASYSITHLPLLRHIAKKGKPMIISVGASSLKDIETAIKTVKDEGNLRIALLQCTAKYPASLSTINLKTIPALAKDFCTIAGLSDHSREPLIAPLGAVALGAKIIEKHFTTDNGLPGPDHGFAILPNELKEMVSGIRKMEQALGNPEKYVLEEEKELFQFCRRGIYTTKDIKKGETFSKENTGILRPGKMKRWLEPKMLEELIGRKAKKAIKKGNAIKKSDFCTKN